MTTDFNQPVRLAFAWVTVLGCLVLSSAEAELHLNQTYRPFDSQVSGGNYYGLIDLDSDTIPRTGNYAECWWGNWMWTDPNALSFSTLTLGQQNYPVTYGKDLFLSRSRSVLNLAPFPTTAQWAAPINGAGQVVLDPTLSVSGPPMNLYRRLHFRTSISRLIAVGQEVELTESGQLADNLILLIHGWNPDGSQNSYTSSDEFTSLSNELLANFTAEPTWQLIRYHWEADADTGYIWRDGGMFGDNATRAAHIAHLHGQHLGELLLSRNPKLHRVHFIAHSAGAWAARAAAKYLLAHSSEVFVQVTLLDPFIPEEARSVWPVAWPASPQSSSLNRQRMSDLAHSSQAARIWQLENYYADDSAFGLEDKLEVPTLGTQSRFDWRDYDVNQQIAYTQSAIHPWIYLRHAGPIKLFADTVSSISGTVPTELAAAPYAGEYQLLGWWRSLFVNELVVDAQPQSRNVTQGDSVSFSFGVRARRQLLNIPGSAPVVTYHWQKAQADGSWTTAYGSDETDTYAPPPLAPGDTGQYRVIANNGTGEVASNVFTINVSLTAGSPQISLSSPVAGAAVGGSQSVDATVSNAVDRVEFYLDGALKSSDTAAPFDWSWNTALSVNGYHTLTAQAYGGLVESLLGISAPITVIVSNGASHPPDVDDYGNSSAQASALTWGTPGQGLVSSPADVDWFKVEVTTPGVLAFNLTVPAGKDYDLELFAPDAAYIKGSYGDTGAAESISYNAVTTGTYYVRVYGYPVGNGSFSATDSYSLTSSFTSGVVADPSIPTSNFNNGSLFVQSSQSPAVIRVTQDGLTRSMDVPFSLVAAKGTILSMDAPPDTSTSRFVGWLVDGSVVSSHSLTMAIPASGVVTLLTETVSSGGNSVPATGAAWQISGPSEVMGGQTASFKLTSTDEQGAEIEANAASWDLSSDGYGSIDYMGNFTAKAGLASQVQLRVFAWAAGSTTNDRIEKQILLLPPPGENYHTVEIFDSPGGSVTLSPEPLIVGGEYVYREGTIVEVLATPDSGKSLKDWGDAALTENPLLLTVTENRILRPNFVSTALLTGPKHITIEKPSGLGRVTITAPRFTHIMERGETRFSSAEISHGEKVYVRVDVDPTEEFIGWLGSGQGAAARFTMVEHVSLVARMRSRLTSLANSSLSRNIEMITYHNLLADGYHSESPDYRTNIIDNGEVIRAQMTAAPRPGLSDSFMDAYLIFQHPELNQFPLHVNSASLKLFPPATAPSIETWVRLYLPSEVLNMPSSATSPAENWSSLPTAIDFGFPLVYSYRWQPLVLGITDQFNGWRSGVLANNGLILRCMRSGYEAMYYASNASEPLVRPVLLLNWDEDAAPLAAPIVISRSPNVLRLAAQQTATLLVDVASDSAVSYKWFRDGQQVIPGSSNQLQIVAVNAATYTVEATNDTGSTTESFAIEILDTTAPQIIADKAIWRTDQLGRVVVTGQALDDRSVSRLAVQSHTVSTVLSGLENWQVEVMAPSGTHYLNIGVFDAAGNMSEVTVLVVNPVGDVVPPLVQASATRLSNGRIEITWQVTDNTGAARIQMMASNYLVYEQNDPFNIGKAEFSVPSHATQIEITAVDLAGNSAGIVLGIVAAELPATSNLDTWRFDAFTSEETANVQISGPNAVYGHDGLPNLVKYALGLEPKQNITTGLPEVGIVGSDWVYTYARPSDRTDVTYAVEVSSDLVNWSTTGVIHELASSVGATETWRARYPISSASKVFFRLRVSN